LISFFFVFLNEKFLQRHYLLHISQEAGTDIKPDVSRLIRFARCQSFFFFSANQIESNYWSFSNVKRTLWQRITGCILCCQSLGRWIERFSSSNNFFE